MSAQFEVQNLAVESVVPFVDQKSMDVVVENQPDTQPKTKKELKMTKKTKKLIMLCGQFYGFDGEEAITRLLNNEKPKKEKKAKEPRKRKSVASNPEDGEKKKRGRPAKTVKVVEESQVVDMFADIVSKDDVAPEEEHVETPVETVVETKKAKKAKVLSEEEKEAKEAKKVQEKAEKEAKEAKKVQEKAEKEAKEAKKAQEKAEKEAKKAQEKAENEAKKAQEKAQKEAEKAEKETKKAQEKAEKEAKKAEKPAKKPKAKAEKKAPASVSSTPVVSDAELEAESESEQESEQEVFKVKKFEHKGTSYLRTRNGDNWHENGHIYNMDQDLVGFWNEETQDIKFVEEGECAEEEYEE
jgi:hypothetical protein